MYGFMMALCMRMWRVYRVYDLYTRYLANSKQAFDKRYQTEPDSPTALHRQNSARSSIRVAHDRNLESLSSLDSSVSDVYLQADKD